MAPGPAAETNGKNPFTASTALPALELGTHWRSQWASGHDINRATRSEERDYLAMLAWMKRKVKVSNN